MSFSAILNKFLKLKIYGWFSENFENFHQISLLPFPLVLITFPFNFKISHHRHHDYLHLHLQQTFETDFHSFFPLVFRWKISSFSCWRITTTGERETHWSVSKSSIHFLKSFQNILKIDAHTRVTQMSRASEMKNVSKNFRFSISSCD